MNVPFAQIYSPNKIYPEFSSTFFKNDNNFCNYLQRFRPKYLYIDLRDEQEDTQSYWDGMDQFMGGNGMLCCGECRNCFPNDWLLQLHIREIHDPFNTKMVNLNCVIPSCQATFSSADERKNHLVEIHKFNSDYRYFKNLRCQNESLNSMADSTDMRDDFGKLSQSSITSNIQFEENQKASKRMPKHISFGGRGARSKTFLTKQWNQQNRTGMGSKNFSTDFDMQEVAQSLPDKDNNAKFQ